jgi:hypothetical protein
MLGEKWQFVGIMRSVTQNTLMLFVLSAASGGAVELLGIDGFAESYLSGMLALLMYFIYYVASNKERFLEKDWKAYVWGILILFFAFGSLIVTYTATDTLSSSPAAFDSEEDLVNRSVNTSWIYMETGRWQVDPSGTTLRRVKLEQNGTGLIVQQPIKLPEGYIGSTYNMDGNWDATISQIESRGVTYVGGPRLEKVNRRNFSILEFEKYVQNITVPVNYIFTEEGGRQYSFVYSYTDKYVSEGHLERTLSTLSKARYKAD